MGLEVGLVLRRVVLVVSVTVTAAVLSAGPALASISGDGNCTGKAVLRGDDGSVVNVDAKAQDHAEIPRAATVEYEGSIEAEGDDMSYSGHVELKVDGLPGGPVVKRWSWPDVPDDTTDESATTGNESYDLDLPADILGGVKGEAKGEHTQAGKSCTGTVEVEIAGSVVNPGSVVSAVLTGASAAGLAVAARGKR